ncbi:MAG: respiratory nitrate reductase subunit gamma [Nitrososphaerota archaeon]|nr:respiratory nitrate reductase subunit gamma [Nitrososphaerota archaeon]
MIDLIIQFFSFFFPYVTLVLFLTLMSYRIITWLIRPMPVSWVLYPVLHSKVGVGRAILKDVVTLGSHFKADKRLWVAAITFHISFIVFAPHIIYFLSGTYIAIDPILLSLGMSKDSIFGLKFYLGSISGVIATITVFYFILWRIFCKKAREISSKEDYFNLTFLLLVILLGTYLRVYELVPANEYINYFLSLVSFNPIQPPTHPLFLAHFILAQLYLIYFPFSKCAHFMGLFVNQWIVRREW